MNSNQLVYEPSKTTHWRNLFPNKTMLLGAHNLNPGEQLVAEIKSVGNSEIKNKKGGAKVVPIITFTNAPPMILNITNCNTITSLYGDDYSKWIGKSIQIFVKNIPEVFGRDCALRIVPRIPISKSELDQYIQALDACSNLDKLRTVFMGMPKTAQHELTNKKNELKTKLQGGQHVQG